MKEVLKWHEHLQCYISSSGDLYEEKSGKIKLCKTRGWAARSLEVKRKLWDGIMANKNG